MILEENIKEWVALDNKMKNYKDTLKQLRNEKNIIMQNILFLAENRNLKNTTIQISDGKLKIQNNKITSPLTLKYIKFCLSKNSNERYVDKSSKKYIYK